MSEQALLTPQQELFLAEYTNPKSGNFGNALQAALKAGYSQTYAENITDAMPDWLLENIGDMKRLRKAEKNLDEVQNIQIYNEEGKIDANLVDKRTKVDMFLAERLNKDKYSSRVEQTGKGGKDLIPETITKEEQKELLGLLKEMRKIYKVEDGKLYSAEVEKDIRKNGGDCYFCGKPVYISSGQLLKHIKGKPTHKPCRK